ncbi:hypothetical protein [Ferruginivarius sediminum]|uniref:Uncharacterized protein n=1 Tax=Ferruginivarius sediminum TaxID=2661937 RepID=A0A369T6R2_9PROT|nr:hypothetical protein [Ferruginivarius sediminum]RDD61010.1 hypothetical protein DRB17_14890 [Ferruginivarius sediminum]
MTVSIQPNHLISSDTRPSTSYLIRTGNEPRWIEVVVTTDPTLARPENQARRTAENFFSTRGYRERMEAQRGEAVFVLPAAILARFVGQERLYHGVAAFDRPSGGQPIKIVWPDERRPYVDISGLTGRTLRRTLGAPNPRGELVDYGDSNGDSAFLTWAGDAARPGKEPATAAPPAPGPGMNGNGNGEGAQQPNGAGNGNGNGGEVAAQSYVYDDGFGPMPQPAAPMAGDIPLDPGAGGRSIATSALEMGDIILSTGDNPISAAIRRATGQHVSHSMVYIGPDEAGTHKVIESVAEGVVERGLAEAIADASVAVAFRHPSLTAEMAGQLVSTLRGLIGHDYDFGGILRQARFRVGPDSDERRRVVLGTDNDDKFFCSELVLEAYRRVGLPLSETPPHWSSPGDIADVLMPIGYVGHLKAEVTVDQLSHMRHPRAGARTLGGAMPEVDVKLRVFIPAPAIGMDVPALGTVKAFGGDGRSFDYSRGTSRAEIHGRVRLGAPGAAPQVTVVDRHWAESLEYDASDVSDVSGKPDWWKQVREGATPTDRARHRLSDDNLSLRLGGGSLRSDIEGAAGDATPVTFHVEGNLPLLPGSPDIDAHITVFLLREGDNVRARVYGTHDRFPAYELYVNQRRIYAYNPVAAGNGPTSLSGSSDQRIDGDYVDAGPIVATQAMGMGGGTMPAGAFYGAAAESLGQTPHGGGRSRSSRQPYAHPHAAWAVVGEAVAGAVAGTTLERLTDDADDIEWTVERFHGWKHVGDNASNKGRTADEQDKTVLIRSPVLANWYGVDEIYAHFPVTFRYDGRSVGNVQVAAQPRNMSGSIGIDLTVRAQVRDLPGAFQAQDGRTMAGVKITFFYEFDRAVGNNDLYVQEVHLYGDGRVTRTGHWTQSGITLSA